MYIPYWMSPLTWYQSLIKHKQFSYSMQKTCSWEILTFHGNNQGQENLIQTHKYMPQQIGREAHGQIKQM